ncbi:hypothetical protein H6790_02580 [Candidatus Nomurabacteria bacterium]|nr:hypothetical protein [Candidatus Nomurabacteria bacterium]MCB9820806.1 hypothetical protein [Candidatus Nomurabacteria bacterium]
MSKFKHKNKNEGFLILFTVLIAVVVLSIVLGISSTAYKEAILSNAARNSQQAFFSADTGLECALYLDRVVGAFIPSGDPFAEPDCGTIRLNYFTSGSYDYAFEADLDYGSCAVVTIEKNLEVDPEIPELTATQIISKGYNVSCDQLDSFGSLVRVVERQLDATYQNPLPVPVP